MTNQHSIAPHIRIACNKAGITDEQRMLNIQSGREALAPPAMTVRSPPQPRPAFKRVGER